MIKEVDRSKIIFVPKEVNGQSVTRDGQQYYRDKNGYLRKGVPPS